MIAREHYPINEASEITGYSVEDLLHFGATKKITLHLNYTHRSMMNGLVIIVTQPDKTEPTRYSEEHFFPKDLLPVMPEVCRAFEGVHSSRSMCINSLFFKTLEDGRLLWLIPFNPNLDTGLDVFEVYRSELFLLGSNVKDLIANRHGLEITEPTEFEKRCNVLKTWLEKNGYSLDNGTVKLQKGINHNSIHNQLNQLSSDKALFNLELDSFKKHFWQKQKLAKLPRGRRN